MCRYWASEGIPKALQDFNPIWRALDGRSVLCVCVCVCVVLLHGGDALCVGGLNCVHVCMFLLLAVIHCVSGVNWVY